MIDFSSRSAIDTCESNKQKKYIYRLFTDPRGIPWKSNQRAIHFAIAHTLPMD